MLDLESVTLVAIAGVEVRSALAALRISSSGIRFESTLLLTHEHPRFLDKSISIVPIRHLSSHIEYNSFVLYELADFIETTHCLLVQADGYVRHPQSWDPKFLDYDYIGAPWPLSSTAYVDPFGHQQRVGNGGFSLRSKHLLTTPKRLHVEWEVNEGNFYRHMDAESYSEDGNICVHNRHVYEADGCKFAPLDIAARFSRELNVVDAPSIRRPFGFHRYGLRTGRPTKAPRLLGFRGVPTQLDPLRIH